MPIITLPDGKHLDFPKKVTGLEVAKKISESLAKQALIMSVNGELKDLYFLIEKNSSVKIFTAKDPEGLDAVFGGKRALLMSHERASNRRNLVRPSVRNSHECHELPPTSTAVTHDLHCALVQGPPSKSENAFQR